MFCSSWNISGGGGDYSGYEGGKAGLASGPHQSQPTEGSNMSSLGLTCKAFIC